MSELKYVHIDRYTTYSGMTRSFDLSYQLFGKPLHEAPIVLVNHALTGNSTVAGPEGWWQDLIGKGRCIDTDQYTVLAFNIPGNGYDGNLEGLIDSYQDFIAKDVAHLFALGIEQLKIERLFAVIGGSVGGGIAWELAALRPTLIEHLIPVATDWKSTDWLIANCLLQDRILNNSSNPIEDARIHAMMCYRTPESFKDKFDRSLNEELGIFNIESWLLHHGDKLKNRFQLAAYKFINQLLKTMDIARDGSFEEVAKQITAKIHVVGVDTDLFFTPNEARATVLELKSLGVIANYHEISSRHGHDAFLIEYDQLHNFLQPIFSTHKIKVAS